MPISSHKCNTIYDCLRSTVHGTYCYMQLRWKKGGGERENELNYAAEMERKREGDVKQTEVIMEP